MNVAICPRGVLTDAGSIVMLGATPPGPPQPDAKRRDSMEIPAATFEIISAGR